MEKSVYYVIDGPYVSDQAGLKDEIEGKNRKRPLWIMITA